MKVLTNGEQIELVGLSGNVLSRWVDLRSNPRKQYYLFIPPSYHLNEIIKERIGIHASLFGRLTPGYECHFFGNVVLYDSLEGASALYWKLKEAIDGGVKLDIVKINDDYERRALGIETILK